MRTNQSHLPKSPEERDYYSRYIRKKDYDQTVDQSIRFPESDISAKDFEAGKKVKERKKPMNERISDHFEDNWLKWLFAGVALIISIFVYNFWINQSNHEIRIDTAEKNIDKISDKLDKNTETLHEHDKRIEINKIQIEDLKKKDSN